MPSNFQSNEPEAVSGSELQPQPQANRIEIARYDEEMQQRIIALAGALQDRERATVSLTQLEAAAQEVGLEPRFVREAARQLAAVSSPFPLVRGEDEQPERRAAQAQEEIARAAFDGYPVYGALAESNLDAPPPEASGYMEIANRINTRLLETQSPEPLVEPFDLTGGMSAIEHASPAQKPVPLMQPVGKRGVTFASVVYATLMLVMPPATLAVYGVAFLCLFTPLSESVRIVAALFFGAMAAYLTRATRNIWRDAKTFWKG